MTHVYASKISLLTAERVSLMVSLFCLFSFVLLKGKRTKIHGNFKSNSPIRPYHQIIHLSFAF